jgi:RHS repeat-associated protein
VLQFVIHSDACGYDTAGRLNQVQDSLLNALGGTIGNVGYGYDAASNRTSVAFDASQGTWTTTSTFDTGERLASVVNAGATLAQFGYDPLARLTGTTFLDSSSVGYAYETDDDLQTLTQNFTAGTVALGYTRNGAHQIIGMTVTDPTYLMKQVGASASYVPNGLNQYTQVAGAALSYDSNGNLTGDGTSVYSFDEENRLRQVVMGGVTSVYDYDPLGRRRAKTVGATTTYFVNDGANELAELSSTGVRQRAWAYAVGMDDRIGMYDDAGGTGWRFYHVNHQGSVLFTTRQGTGGAIADQYQYGPYGEPLPGAPASSNPFRYTGRYLDAESGLYYYRARFYSPKLGRFLQTDPIGTKDDLNLYTYVYNDPVDGMDPAGLADNPPNPKRRDDGCTGTRIAEACGKFGNSGTAQGENQVRSSRTAQARGPQSEYGSPSFSEAFDEQAAEFFEPLASAADSATDFWAEEGGVLGATFGTFAATVNSNNIGNTVSTAGTSYLGGSALRGAAPLGRAFGPAGSIFGRSRAGGSSLFGINSKGVLRIGWGWKGTSTNGTNVFRISGTWVKKVGVESGHIDLFSWP